MSDEKLNQVSIGEFHPNGRLCVSDKCGKDCEHYESNEQMHVGLYHTCGSCTHWGCVGDLRVIGTGNACFHDKNIKPEQFARIVHNNYGNRIMATQLQI